MKVLQNRLNFTIRHFHPIDKQWGGYIAKNKTVFGIARFLTEGKADMISAFFGVNVDRFNAIDYMFAPVDVPHVFAIRSTVFILLNFKVE